MLVGSTDVVFFGGGGDGGCCGGVGGDGHMIYKPRRRGGRGDETQWLTTQRRYRERRCWGLALNQCGIIFGERLENRLHG